MKFIKIISSRFIIFLLTGMFSCGPGSRNARYETLTFSQNDQQFTIVSFYKHMPAYIKAAERNRSRIAGIYKRLVFDPIWNDFASKGECSFLAKSLEKPITDLENLAHETALLGKSNAEEIIKTALLKVSKILPGPNTTVYIQALDPVYKKYLPEHMQTGITAHTFGSGRIIILVDPRVPDWKQYLQKITAHEYHHSVWVSRNFETVNFSLLEYLTLEGRADSFAELIYPDIKSPWVNMFDFEKEKDVWYFLRDRLNSRDADLLMRTAAGDKNTPFASVYTIGYRIMQDFFKNNPDVTLQEWTDMEAEDIFRKSNYEAKFN